MVNMRHRHLNDVKKSEDESIAIINQVIKLGVDDSNLSGGAGDKYVTNYPIG